MKILFEEDAHNPWKSENVIMVWFEGKRGVRSAGIIETKEYGNDGLVIARYLVNMDDLVLVILWDLGY